MMLQTIEQHQQPLIATTSQPEQAPKTQDPKAKALVDVECIYVPVKCTPQAHRRQKAEPQVQTGADSMQMGCVWRERQIQLV